MPKDPDEIRRQMRTLLTRQLEAADWAEIDAALAAAVEALDARDEAALERQRARIRRIAQRFSRGLDPRLGEPDRRPAAETTKSLVNRVVDRLGPPEDGK